MSGVVRCPPLPIASRCLACCGTDSLPATVAACSLYHVAFQQVLGHPATELLDHRLRPRLCDRRPTTCIVLLLPSPCRAVLAAFVGKPSVALCVEGGGLLPLAPCGIGLSYDRGYHGVLWAPSTDGQQWVAPYLLAHWPAVGYYGLHECAPRWPHLYHSPCADLLCHHLQALTPGTSA